MTTDDGYEIRVWCENGDLVGYATVQRRPVVIESGYYSMTVQEAPSNSGYVWPAFGFATYDEAVAYAREWAEGLAQWTRETCVCFDADCGVMSEHGISVQEVTE